MSTKKSTFAASYDRNDVLGFLPADSSLKTTDELQVLQLLNYTPSFYYAPKIRNNKVWRHNYNQLFCEIDGLLNEKECEYIINTAEQNCDNFMSMSSKYDSTIRNNQRLLTIDKHLANVLNDRLKPLLNKHILHSNDNLFSIPLGFDVIQHNNVNKEIAARNDWEFDTVNNCIRVNRYQADCDNHFSFHRDAQYIEDVNKRSLFTLVIYLNDGFEEGETVFYIEKTKEQLFNIHKYYNNNGFTIENEMDYYSNIANNKVNTNYETKFEDNFIVYKVKPKRGSAVLFSHNIIHRACNVNSNKTGNIPKNANKNSNNSDSDTNTSTATTSKCVYKYTLKTEIVMKRDAKIRKKYQQFAISSYESKDYINCINYFREAQQQELAGNYKESNRFYELCLSLRYLYPVKLAMDLINNENNNNNHNNRNRQKLMEIPFDIWKVIFNYTPAREIEIVSLLFPNILYPIIKIYRKQQNQFERSGNLNDNYYDRLKSDVFKHEFNPLKLSNKQLDNLPLYIPNLLMQYGSFNLFEFRDVKFYNKHKKQCNFVIAMYSLYLFSNSSKYNYYVFKYNPFTQNIKCVSLFQLLKDVFYSRKCFGKYFKIMKKRECPDNTQKQKFQNQNKNKMENESKSDVYKILDDKKLQNLFDKSIDREYMTLVHGL